MICASRDGRRQQEHFLAGGTNPRGGAGFVSWILSITCSELSMVRRSWICATACRCLLRTAVRRWSATLTGLSCPSILCTGSDRMYASASRLSFLYADQTVDANDNKKLSYRKQIAHQLRIQYVEGIYSNSVTMKSRLGVSKSHWKRHHSIDRIRVPISVPQ